MGGRNGMPQPRELTLCASAGRMRPSSPQTSRKADEGLGAPRTDRERRPFQRNAGYGCDRCSRRSGGLLECSACADKAEGGEYSSPLVLRFDHRACRADMWKGPADPGRGRQGRGQTLWRMAGMLASAPHMRKCATPGKDEEARTGLRRWRVWTAWRESYKISPLSGR